MCEIMNEKNGLNNEVMKKIQSEIKDIIISKLTDRVIEQERAIKEYKSDYESVKKELVTLVKKILTDKTKYPQNILKSPANKTTSPKVLYHHKTQVRMNSSYLSPKLRLNHSTYCTTEPVLTKTKSFKQKDYVNTLYKRNSFVSEALDNSQVSSNHGTINIGNPQDNDTSLFSSRKNNLSNISSLNLLTEPSSNKRSLIGVNSNSSSFKGNGMKKKVSLTKLSFRSLHPTSNPKYSSAIRSEPKVVSFMSPRVKPEKQTSFYLNDSKYNNKVNRKKKFI